MAPTSPSPILLCKFPVLWRATGPQTSLDLALFPFSNQDSHSLFTMQISLLFSLALSPHLCITSFWLSLFTSKKGRVSLGLPPTHNPPSLFLIIPISMTGSKPRSHYAETPSPSPPPQPLHMFHSTYLVSLCSQFGSGRANSSLIKQGDK